MKINISDEVKEKTLISHMVLHNMSTVIVNELIKQKSDDGVWAEILLTVNGHEMPLRSFCDHWQSQVRRMIKETAAEIVEERFSGISELFYDLETRLKEEINMRLEDGEKEEGGINDSDILEN